MFFVIISTGYEPRIAKLILNNLDTFNFIARDQFKYSITNPALG